MPFPYIPTKGFKNVRDKNGQIIGFQFWLTSGGSEGGIAVNRVKGIRVRVDGEEFSRDQITVTLRGRTYKQDELAKQPESVRWEFFEPATITVLKPGGLKPGMHDVEQAEDYNTVSYSWGIYGYDLGGAADGRDLTHVEDPGQAPLQGGRGSKLRMPLVW